MSGSLRQNAHLAMVKQGFGKLSELNGETMPNHRQNIGKCVVHGRDPAPALVEHGGSDGDISIISGGVVVEGPYEGKIHLLSHGKSMKFQTETQPCGCPSF